MVDNSNQLVVVAIPSENDYVWKVSSEKVPHMTLLYLGAPGYTPAQLTHITDYIGHASSLLYRFGMDVDHRGLLGDQDADVLFFNKTYDYRKLIDFRGHLLQDNDISRAYNSVSQYPDWTPHLTMGFPATPAKEDTRDYPGFNWVNFDRIALWTSDSEGPTFQLKERTWLEDFGMGQSQLDGTQAVENILKHYGKKGMKWGVRKDNPMVPAGTVRVSVTDKGKLKPSGGKGFNPAEEAVKKVALQQVAKKSGLHTLTNEQLQAAVNRMNLEQQFVRLSPTSKRTKAKKFIAETLLGIGKQQATRVGNDVAAKQVGNLLSKAATK